MESKTKHRILGIAVVAGLAFLMYPFMAGQSNLPSEKALVKAPDFPDQATQISVGSEDVIGMPATDDVAANSQPEQNAVTAPQPGTADNQPTPNVMNIADKPAVPTNVAAEIPALTEPVAAAPAKTDVKANEAAPVVAPIVENKSAKIRSIQKKIAGRKVKKLANAGRVRGDHPVIHSRIARQTALSSFSKTSIGNNGLMDLKRAAYVIQLGSFKQKSNALRLVNKLRAKGYRAFIQAVDASNGDNTRVFVGPEHQQTSARLVATQLEKEMRLHGIVISYKPFTL